MNKLIELEIYLQSENIDIMCLSEHWLQNHSICNINVLNFSIVSSFCRSNSSHGGTLILVRNTIASNVEQIAYCSESVVEGHIEISGISISKVAILCIYRPPNGSVPIFINYLSKLLVHVTKKCDSLILCGDLNIDYLSSSHEKHLLIDLFSSFCLDVTTHTPTRVFSSTRGVSSSAIDYLATNIPNNMFKCKIIDPSLSDHCSHILNLSLSSANMETRIGAGHFVRNYSRFNLDCLAYELHRTSFTNLFVESNVDKAFNLFFDILSNSIEKNCPLQYIRPRACEDTTRRTNNWYSNDLLLQKKYLNELSERVRLSESAELHALYKTEKKNYKYNIRAAKTAYFENKINSSHNKSKAVWDIVNRELNRRQVGRNKIKILKNDVMLHDDLKIANEFANYFSSVAGSCVRESVGQNLSLPYTTATHVPNSMVTPLINPEMVLNTIDNFQNKNTTDMDGLSVKVVKHLKHVLCVPLTHLFNLSLAAGSFPACLKKAIVLPLHKKKKNQFTTSPTIDKFLY